MLTEMPIVHQFLITLRSLIEDEPLPPKDRKRGHHNSKRSNRSRQTTALVLTFRDLFRSGGLNVLLDEIDANRRPSKKNIHNVSCTSNRANCVTEAVIPVTNEPRHVPDSRLVLACNNAHSMTLPRLIHQDETSPLLQEDSASIICTDLVPSPSIPMHSSGLFSSLAFVKRKKKPEPLTVPLNPEDENKTVDTLKKVLKWSPRKQNSTTFAVSLPVEEKHTALAVVENAVNRVKEEQLVRKKKRKFLWLKFC